MPKILLVEDDNNLREIFDMRLQAEGYKTVTAGDGEEALVIAVKEKPDLVIADVMMPKLSGFEMVENMRADLPM
jgi:DNA-binding response OmpR family regulator